MFFLYLNSPHTKIIIFNEEYNIKQGMISEISLRNWKSHEDTKLIFGRGTNVLMGPMGAGKSSVTDAICFALFGTFPALQARKLKIDDVIMDKPEIKNDAGIEMRFSLGGENYTVARRITRGKGTTHSEIRKGGTLLEAPNSNRVTEVIKKVLDVDYELFSRAVYSEQNQLDYFLEIPPNRRKEKIDELLRIDRFENARKNLTTVINQLRARSKDRKAQVKDMSSDRMLENIPAMEAELNKLRKENVGRKEKVEKMSRTYGELGKKVTELEKREKESREMQSEATSLKSKLDEMASRVEELKSRIGRKKANADDVDELKKKERELEKSLAELNRRLAERKMLDQRLAELGKPGKSSGEIGRELEKSKKKLRELDDALVKAQTRVEGEAERIEKLGKTGNKCPVCDSRISEHTKEKLSKYAWKIVEKLESDIESYKKEREKLDLESLEKELEKSRERDRLLEQSRRLPAIGELESKAKGLTKEGGEISERRAELERILEMLSEVSNLEKREKETEDKLYGLKDRLKKLSFDEEELRAIRTERERVGIVLREEETSLKLTAERIEDKQRLLDELQDKKKMLKKLSYEVKFLDDSVDNLRVLQSALENTQVALRQEFTESLNAGLDDVWARIYPYGDYTSLRLGVEEKSYLLQVKRTSDGNWVDADGIASGGERSAACLALRIAFSLVLTQNLSWLILDEPTHNLDSNAVQGLARAMREHLPELVEQIFLITHDENMEQAVSGYLYRLEREKKKDEPTRVNFVRSE
jgi:exonuclease SbcC